MAKPSSNTKGAKRRRRPGLPQPARKQRRHRESWIPTLALATIIATGLTLFAALQQPSIDGSLSTLIGRSSLDFLVRNATPLPMLGLRYSCAAARTAASDDITGEPPRARPPDIDLLWPNQSTTARCDNVYRTDPPQFEAQYSVALSYYVFPIPYRWNVTRTLVALIEKGRIVRWTPK